MVIRRCRQLLRDDDAMDAAQDVFVEILRRGDGYSIEYPSSLLFRIATNLSLNRIRDRKPAYGLADGEVLHQIANFIDSADRLDAWSSLRVLFGRHDEMSRTMAVLHYLDGMTLLEVATETGYSVSGVRKRLRSLRRALRELELPEESE